MDAKKMVGKSKIFKYLQNQSNDITPKFIYTKVDPDKDGRRIIEDSIE